MIELKARGLKKNLNDYVEKYIGEEVQKVRHNPRSINLTPLPLPRWTTTTASSSSENFETVDFAID